MRKEDAFITGKEGTLREIEGLTLALKFANPTARKPFSGGAADLNSQYYNKGDTHHYRREGRAFPKMSGRLEGTKKKIGDELENRRRRH